MAAKFELHFHKKVSFSENVKGLSLNPIESGQQSERNHRRYLCLVFLPKDGEGRRHWWGDVELRPPPHRLLFANLKVHKLIVLQGGNTHTGGMLGIHCWYISGYMTTGQGRVLSEFLNVTLSRVFWLPAKLWAGRRGGLGGAHVKSLDWFMLLGGFECSGRWKLWEVGVRGCGGSPTEPTVLTRGLRQYQGVIKRGIGGTPHLSLLHDPVFEEFHVNTWRWFLIAI